MWPLGLHLLSGHHFPEPPLPHSPSHPRPPQAPTCSVKRTEVLMPHIAILIGQCGGSGVEQPPNPKGTESCAAITTGNSAALPALHPRAHTLLGAGRRTAPLTPLRTWSLLDTVPSSSTNEQTCTTRAGVPTPHAPTPLA